MKPTIDHEMVVTLLRKSLDGSLSSEQQLELATLLQENKELAALNQKLCQGDLIAQRLADYERYDATEAFAALRRQTTRYNPLRSRIMVAAALAASIAIGLTFWFYTTEIATRKEHQQTMAQASQILPGSSKAHIKLANGQVVELGTAAVDLDIAGLGSVQVERGAISYQGDAVIADSMVDRLNEVFVPRGGECMITLDDGTKVWLNAESSLSYPVKFSPTERVVSLSGEAFFDVTPNSAQPFIVHSGKMELTVKGTSFNVKNYAQESTASATLLTGLLQVQAGGRSVEIHPSYQALLTQNSSQLSVHKVDPYAFCSWTDNKFVFASQQLDQVLNSVARWYDIEIAYHNIDPAAYVLTGKIPRDVALDQVLEILEMITDVRFTLEGRKLTLNKR